MELPSSSENLPGITETSAPDSPGTGETPATPSLGERVADAGNAALSGAKPPSKRKGGWPKGQKRSFPGGPMADGPVPTPTPKNSASLPPPDFEPVTSPFDEEGAGALVDGALEALNDLASNFQSNAAMRFTGDKEIAAQAGVSARMSEKVRGTVRTGALACLRKYMVDMSYAPEMTLALGAGLWALGNWVAYKKLREMGQQIGRVTAQPAEPVK